MTKPEWLKSKIGRRFAFYVGLIGILAAITFSIIISYQQYKNRLSFIKEELNSIILSSKPLIEETLWIMDFHLLDVIVRSLLVDEDIVFVQIKDENKEIIAKYGKLDVEHDIIKTVPLYYKKQKKNVFLGELKIAASKQKAYQEAKSAIIITLIQSVLLMSFISLSIIYLFWFLVSKHLIKIQQYTKELNFEEPQKPLVLDRPKNKYKEDELSSMVEAINLMYHKALEAYRKLERETSEKIKLEQQLLQAQKLETIGRLVAGIAHDFNNILSVILGYSDLLLTILPEDNPIRKKIERIHEAGDKAAALTRQLLAFSRKQILEKKIISVNNLIKNFVKVWGKMVGENITIKTYLSDKDCIIEADPAQIEQVLMNLIVNAKDAMPNGGEIIIETKEIEFDKQYSDIKPGKYVLITVSDTGEGIDKNILPKIFDPFFTTKEQGKGTGLGLATVYGIIKQHNGYIHVYSEKGKGTTFKIYLPVCSKNLEKIEDKTGHNNLPRGNETILIVDDDQSVRGLIAEMLKELGYNCLEAASGEEAINLLTNYKDQVHLLLTDVVMPGISGKELAEKIKKERPEIKVIFMSGYTENIMSKHGVFKQGVNYISKPIIPGALAQKIRKVLDEDGEEEKSN